MTIFGKSVSEYFAFQKAIVILIILVGIGRLTLSLAGFPSSSVKWISLTAMGLLGLVYCAIQVPRNGGYKHLLPLFVMQAGAGNIIVAGSIALATGTDNIYTLPEYSGGTDGKTWFHAGAHIVVGLIVGPLIAWLIGPGIIFVVKFALSFGFCISGLSHEHTWQPRNRIPRMLGMPRSWLRRHPDPNSRQTP